MPAVPDRTRSTCDGNAYVTGLILSPDMATTNAAQTRLLSRDAFVAKLIPDGSAFSYFTYLGGRGTDYGQSIAVDAAGNAYVGGYTDSRDLPVTEGVLQPQISGNSDGFIAKINDPGSSIVWATYLGGGGRTNPPDEIVQSIVVDPDGCIYVTGATISDDFPVTRAVQEQRAGARDAFIAKITPAADKLIFSTFAGGTGNEDGMAIAVTPLRAFYVVGQTVSTDLPREKPLSEKLGSNSDAFVTRICDPVMFLSAGSEFQYVQGAETLPASQLLRIAACKNLEISAERDAEAEWLKLDVGAADGGIMPVTLSVSPEALEPGEYTATGHRARCVLWTNSGSGSDEGSPAARSVGHRRTGLLA